MKLKIFIKKHAKNLVKLNDDELQLNKILNP